jgi:hypothetical protein
MIYRKNVALTDDGEPRGRIVASIGGNDRRRLRPTEHDADVAVGQQPGMGRAVKAGCGGRSRLLAEGGAIHLHGHKEPNGTWRFIGWGGTMGIDEDGDYSVRVNGIKWCKDLSKALPHELWIRFISMYVHPELRDWFRSHYAEAVATLPEHRRESHNEFRHHKWPEMLQSTRPDRRSRDDTL